MTVHDLYVIITNLYSSTNVTVYDRHKNLLYGVSNWGSLLEYYSDAEVLFFNYESGEITFCEIFNENEKERR